MLERKILMFARNFVRGLKYLNEMEDGKNEFGRRWNWRDVGNLEIYKWKRFEEEKFVRKIYDNQEWWRERF